MTKMEDERTEVELLRSIEQKLDVLIAVALSDFLQAHRPEREKNPSIEALLIDAGLTNAEVGRKVGVTGQAIGQGLRAPAKKRKR